MRDIEKQVEHSGNDPKGYVGPSQQYDYMGATQFALLSALGLRAHHKLLDIGCGSLRAGRFFIQYLNSGNYYGIEPNEWLVHAAKNGEIGRDLFDLKKPSFSNSDDFQVEFEGKFDFILAQSIFSHTELQLLEKALKNIKPAMSHDSLMICTFLEASRDSHGDRWVYPECVTFRPKTLQTVFSSVGLHGTRIPWFHPRQDWYIVSKDKRSLPNILEKKYLRGAILNSDELAASRSFVSRSRRRIRSWVARRIPEAIKEQLKN
ncbi:class I SAM-dependent methyltransferase [Ruegeria sp. R13_0]|uniref:class I SAM-dependent methyltransferase n=1 Tax=Ruegeria sp. R13_0 TaxID=2821099 RepID=UPI001ADBE5C0|nr:class I SAM-dependent methyltransferase [Ruegeria sp. R13_0]MBO9436729.1 class I SAM-dependent methyltransferase [Ruegeria sp. R13_0]